MRELLPLAIGICTFVAAALVLTPSREARLRKRLGEAPAARREPRLRTLVPRLAQATEERLAGSRLWVALERRCERAGIRGGAARVLYAAAAVGVAVAIVVSWSASPIVGLPAGPLVGLSACLTTLSVLARRRLAAFEAQLPEVTTSLASSLRAGHGLMQALQTVAADVGAPAGEELRRVLAEARVGRPFEAALDDLAERVPSEDLRFLLVAIGLQRQVGGSLAGLLDTVTETVRQRQQFGRKVRALTATVRTSANVLVGLPVLVAVVLTIVNRDYMRPLLKTGTGHLLIALALGGMACGTAILRRIAAVRG